MNQLKVFENQSFGDLEILEKEEKVFFPAADVAKKLGYAKPHDAISRHCKEMGTLFHGVIDSMGRMQNKKFIDEGNLYRLIVNSKLPQAEQFERWVFDEVLPELRRSGSYELTDDPLHLLELSLKAIKQSDKRIEKVEEKVVHLENEVKLDPGEYSYITSSISRNVRRAIDLFGLANTREVKKELFKDINRGLNEVCGIKTRTQLKQKNFNQALEYIEAWTPSTATKLKVRQITMDFEKEAQKI